MRSMVVNVFLAVMGGILVFGGLSWAGDPLSQRQHRQETQIVIGVRNGTITSHELAGLRREQARIQELKARAWADGCLSRTERQRIRSLQERAGRHIHWAQHNRAHEREWGKVHGHHHHPMRPVHHGFHVNGRTSGSGWVVAGSFGWH